MLEIRKRCYNIAMPAFPEEKRKFFRHPIHAPIELHVAREATARHFKTANLSLGGLRFLCMEKLRKGSLLDITIPVKEKSFKIKARVVYTIEDKKHGGYNVGACFYDLPSAFRGKLAEEALEILEYRKRLSRNLGREVSEEEAAERWIAENAASFTKDLPPAA